MTSSLAYLNQMPIYLLGSVMFNYHVQQYYMHLFLQREKECAYEGKPYQCDYEWNRLFDLGMDEEYKGDYC